MLATFLHTAGSYLREIAENVGHALRDFQVPYARPTSEVASWNHDLPNGGISLAEVVRQVHRTIQIGTSTAPGTFTEALVKDMAAHMERPIIVPLSNPTERMEATASDLITWTDGRALVATGVPSHPAQSRCPDRGMRVVEPRAGAARYTRKGRWAAFASGSRAAGVGCTWLHPVVTIG
jgi:hypothetical protein